MEQWQAFLAGCAAIATIGGAFAVISKFIAPAFSFLDRIEKLEKHQKENFERINKNEETSRILCEGMLCLLEVSEEQTKGNPTNLARIQAAKESIQQYLIRGKPSK